MSSCDKALQLALQLANCGRDTNPIKEYVVCKVAQMRYQGALNACIHETVTSAFTTEYMKAFVKELNKPPY